GGSIKRLVPALSVPAWLWPGLSGKLGGERFKQIHRDDAHRFWTLHQTGEAVGTGGGGISLAAQRAIQLAKAGRVGTGCGYVELVGVEAKRQCLQAPPQHFGSAGVVGQVYAVEEVRSVAAVREDGGGPAPTRKPVTNLDGKLHGGIVLHVVGADAG